MRLIWGNVRRIHLGLLFLLLAVAAGVVSCGQAPPGETSGETLGDATYTNYRVASVPWSIHVAQIPRDKSRYELRSSHAWRSAARLSTLSDQIRQARRDHEVPVAGINGDFYERFQAYAGDPRGLQIVDNELISAPVGGVGFWVDRAGQPHATNVVSRMRALWPNGLTQAFGLNEERRRRSAVLYTAALGRSTHTSGGMELILESSGDGPWLPLRAGQIYPARVREIREGGNAPLDGDTMVLSIDAQLVEDLPRLAPGDMVKINTETWPDLSEAVTAISGGPLLARDGKRVKLPQPKGGGSLSYEFRSMGERHPRAALGWNGQAYYLVQVDGRQRGLSVGMTLDELGDYMTKLGCQHAMNLDGGGSATFWYNGRVRNSLCERHEREIANALLAVRKERAAGQAQATPPSSSSAN